MKSIARIRLFLRMWFRFYRDALMLGQDWANKEYQARMYSFRHPHGDQTSDGSTVN